MKLIRPELLWGSIFLLLYNNLGRKKSQTILREFEERLNRHGVSVPVPASFSTNKYIPLSLQAREPDSKSAVIVRCVYIGKVFDVNSD
jgi:hypothetical protein